MAKTWQLLVGSTVFEFCFEPYFGDRALKGQYCVNYLLFWPVRTSHTY